MLDLGVVLKRIGAHVLAVARLLEAAVRHLRCQRDVVVDPDAAEAKRAGGAHGAADVARPDARRKAVVDVVGPGDRLLLVGERLDGDDRAEDLALDDLVALRQPGDDRRGVEVPRPVDDRAAGDPLGAGGRAVHEPAHAVELRGRDERTHLGVLGRRVADGELLDRGGERGDEVVIDLRPGEHARGRGAVLARVPVARDLHAFDGGLDVGVVEDEHGSLAAELQMQALERVRRDPGDLLAGPDVAGERDHRHVRVAHERRAGCLAVAEDHIQDAGREVLGADLREDRGGHRRLLAGLEYDGVAGSDRRADLPDRHRERIVPRRDLRHHADRLAADHRRVALHVLARRLALHDARRPGEEAQVVGDRRQLLAHGRDRLADVQRLGLADLLAALVDRVGDPQQRERALARRRARPAVECALRRGDSGIDVRRARQGCTGDDRTGRGIVDLLGRTGAGGNEGAADEVVDRRRRCAHRAAISFYGEPSPTASATAGWVI